MGGLLYIHQQLCINPKNNALSQIWDTAIGPEPRFCLIAMSAAPAVNSDKAMAGANNKWIGQSVERLEDPPLVRGRGSFAADISFPHQLHMRIVRSNHAHGRIVAVDAAAARAL